MIVDKIKGKHFIYVILLMIICLLVNLKFKGQTKHKKTPSKSDIHAPINRPKTGELDFK
jgi:hypothetical protein